MRNVAATMLAVLVIAAGASAQTHPDFTGAWRLDLSRSDAAAHAESPGPVNLTIQQSATEITITTVTTRGTSDMTYPFVSAEVPPLTSGPNARWQADALITNALRDVRGQSVTVQQTRRLSRDGTEMIVESIVNVQHGYTATGAQTYGVSKDTFVRVRQ